MLLDGWLGFAVAVLGFIAGIVGVAWAVAGSMGLKLRVRTLEFAVADLEERLLREIKSRAGKLGAQIKKDEDLFDKQVQNVAPQPSAQNQPWWMPMVHKDLKGS